MEMESGMKIEINIISIFFYYIMRFKKKRKKGEYDRAFKARSKRGPDVVLNPGNTQRLR
jgi:hypothetical protein